MAMSKEKADFIQRSMEYWNPGKTADWQRMGVDLVIDRREGYYLYDVDGRRLIDVHLNGGTYSLGHRNPEVVEAVREGMKYFDIGNHHFPSIMRTHVAEMLERLTPEGPQVHDLRIRRSRGDRHCAQECASCDETAKNDLHPALLSRAYRACSAGWR